METLSMPKMNSGGMCRPVEFDVEGGQVSGRHHWHSAGNWHRLDIVEMESELDLLLRC